jgi:hypothetical protein
MKYYRFIILAFVFSLQGITGLSAQSCFETGTLLFKEDFGGNDASDPASALSSVEGSYSDFTFIANGTGAEGGYSLLKHVFHSGSSWWENNNDHTNWGDLTRGYYMFVNPAGGTVGKILFQKQIDGLCSGKEVLLSAWLMDLCWGGKGLARPRITLRISNAVTNAIIQETPVLSPTQWVNAGDVKWERFTLTVLIPEGVSSIKFTLINQESSTKGNDLGLDDIEIFLCTGPVNVTSTINTQNVSFTGSHVNTVFGTNLHSYWLYSTTGDISSLADWTPLDHKTGICATGSTWNHNYTFANAQPGYYRLVVGDSNVLTSFCRAASQVIRIENVPILSNATGTICSGTAFSYTPSGSVVPTGTTYTWSAPSVSGVTGMASETNATTFTSGTLTNTTATAKEVTYTVTPKSGGIAGNPFTVKVTVNPKPIISNVVAAICSGSAHSFTPLGTIPSGTTYTWSAPNVSGVTGTVSGTNASTFSSGTLTNTTASAVNVTYTVTAKAPASAGGCSSTFTVTVTVNTCYIPVNRRY